MNRATGLYSQRLGVTFATRGEPHPIASR